MSPQQTRAFAIIARSQRTVSIGPSLRALATAMGMQPNAARRHVLGLREMGKLEAEDGRGLVVATVAEQKQNTCEGGTIT